MDRERGSRRGWDGAELDSTLGLDRRSAAIPLALLCRESGSPVEMTQDSHRTPVHPGQWGGPEALHLIGSLGC